MLKEDIRLDSLNSVTSTKSYRIEEVPRDELNLSSDEALVPVAHFHREMFATFGMPFLFKIKDVSNITEVLSLLCLPYFSCGLYMYFGLYFPRRLMLVTFVLTLLLFLFCFFRFDVRR